jgi:hypothetical protein
MTETQRAKLREHRWRMDMHLNCEDKAIKRMVNDELNIVAETVTPKFGVINGIATSYGPSITRYYIQGVDGHFDTAAQMAEKLAELGKLGQ